MWIKGGDWLRFALENLRVKVDQTVGMPRRCVSEGLRAGNAVIRNMQLPN